MRTTPSPALALSLALAACHSKEGGSTAEAPADDSGGVSADTGAVDTWDPEATLYENCWSDIDPVAAGFPVYDNFGVVAGRHCLGSDHQNIEGIERLVFLGDSITAGTPPTPSDEIWRTVFAEAMQARFGEDLEIADCSRFGARTDDYADEQIPTCFPAPSDKRTLVVGTMGGNDIFAAASTLLEGGGVESSLAVLDRAVRYQREAMWWFRDNADLMFPNGVAVISANVYEFTDTTGDLSACPMADQLGFGGQADEVAFATGYLNAAWAEIAVETSTDVVFMQEEFCGHGFASTDPEIPCYRGPEAAVYFDLTCIHPTPAGHGRLSEMFTAVVDDAAAPATR
jgi:lysophospholipase L1-like esterase